MPHAQIAKLYINEGSMPICMLHMNSLTSTMWPGALYTDDNDTDNANNDTDDTIAQVH